MPRVRISVDSKEIKVVFNLKNDAVLCQFNLFTFQERNATSVSFLCSNCVWIRQTIQLHDEKEKVIRFFVRDHALKPLANNRFTSFNEVYYLSVKAATEVYGQSTAHNNAPSENALYKTVHLAIGDNIATQPKFRKDVIIPEPFTKALDGSKFLFMFMTTRLWFLGMKNC